MKLQLAGLILIAGNVAASDAAAVDPVRDRQTILAMQGEYMVDFAFDETVLLKSGYERAPAARRTSNEVVVVVEDTPTKIVLQHLLVDAKTGHVIKHWRHDWSYEATQRFEFDSEQTWRVHTLAKSFSTGAWTQCVYEVSDAPRYCGTGRWEYGDGHPTWTSDLSWRPLPRREYTRRSDYNALAVVNRHTLTPNGWTHEQFNTKVLRKPDGTQEQIAREFGFNDYVRTTQVDFTPAYKYWQATAGYWKKVRRHWDDLLATSPGVHLKTKIDGMALITPLFVQAEATAAGSDVADKEIDAVFKQWVAPANKLP